jgi:hypothetical protein
MKDTGIGRRRGRTVVELAVASTAMLIVLGVSIPAFMRIAKAGDEGRTRTYIESDNSVTLTKIARELQNTSFTQVNDVGQPVLSITPDVANAPDYLSLLGPGSGGERTASVDLPAADAVGGPGGHGGHGHGGGGGDDPDDDDDDKKKAKPKSKCDGCKHSGHHHAPRPHSCGLPLGANYIPDIFGATPLNPEDSGSGRRGMTVENGRTRSDAPASLILGDGTDRARNRALPGNSILRFQKAVDFDVDSWGVVTIQWSTPVEYRTIGRRLVRIQDGKTQTVTSNCSCFYVEQTDAGTIVITIVSERRAPTANAVTRHSNQIEVRPKN